MDALALAEIGDLDIAIQKLQLARRYSLGGSASNVPASSQLTLAVAEAVADALNLHETAAERLSFREQLIAKLASTQRELAAAALGTQWVEQLLRTQSHHGQSLRRFLRRAEVLSQRQINQVLLQCHDPSRRALVIARLDAVYQRFLKMAVAHDGEWYGHAA
jgi:hypothetical protein